MPDCIFERMIAVAGRANQPKSGNGDGSVRCGGDDGAVLLPEMGDVNGAIGSPSPEGL